MKEKGTYRQAMQVKAEGQTRNCGPIRFENPEGTGLRVLFIGNSITLHGKRADIGWLGDWGMAASSRDNDYVHRIERFFEAENPDASFCLCNAADWERGYKQGEGVLAAYRAAADFHADWILIKVGANVPQEGFDAARLEESFSALVTYFATQKGVKILIGSDFYHHPANAVIRQYAEKHHFPFCSLEDLCDDESMKAVGLYEHIGVQQHPGDRGMEEIANRMIAEIEKRGKQAQT